MEKQRGQLLLLLLSFILEGGREFFVSYFEMLSPLMSHFSFQDSVVWVSVNQEENLWPMGAFSMTLNGPCQLRPICITTIYTLVTKNLLLLLLFEKVQQCITLHFSKSLLRFIRLGFALEGAISFIKPTTLLLLDFGILMGAELKGRVYLKHPMMMNDLI